MVSPYVLRPLSGASVSTPLHWDEVTAQLDPSKSAETRSDGQFE